MFFKSFSDFLDIFFNPSYIFSCKSCNFVKINIVIKSCSTLFIRLLTNIISKFCKVKLFIKHFCLLCDSFVFIGYTKTFEAFKILLDCAGFFRCDWIYINWHSVERKIFNHNGIKQIIFSPVCFIFLCIVLQENIYFTSPFRILIKSNTFNYRNRIQVI